MKLIIAGGRDYKFTERDYLMLNNIEGVTEVVCGMARGADAFGLQWARLNNIPVAEFPANWSLYGKSAGPIRNQEMAAYADAVALFPGGVGTASMYRTAKNNGLKIYDFRT
jgi:hypothetical protein